MNMGKTWKDDNKAKSLFRSSDIQTRVLYVLNAVGTALFGYEAGPDLFTVINGPYKEIISGIAGMVFIMLCIDYQYISWGNRAVMPGCSEEQRKTIATSLWVSLVSSTVLTSAYLILQFVDWIVVVPASAQIVSIYITRTLAIGSAGILAFQFVQNHRFLRDDPMNQESQVIHDLEADFRATELELKKKTQELRKARMISQYKAEMQVLANEQGDQDAKRLSGDVANQISEMNALFQSAEKEMLNGNSDQPAGN